MKMLIYIRTVFFMRLKRAFSWVRRWHLYVLLVLAVLMLLGLWLEKEQNSLADQVLRLHVLAHSDSPEDQALKLKVRDRVLAEAEQIMPQGVNVEEATNVLADNLSCFARAGEQVVSEEGFDYPVQVELEQVWFPTREYEDFSLPAGEYQALRVIIGDGGGQNWWCVVFPPLCLNSVSESVQETAAEAGLEDRQVALITGESEGYVVKFKAIELWEKLKFWIQEEVSA